MKSLKIATLALAVPILLSAATTFDVTITVQEDGEDDLILQGNTLEWEHLSLFANGGVTGGSLSETNYLGNKQTVNNPYILVSGTDSANSGLNFTNHDWYNGIQGFSCTSSPTLPSCPFLDPNFEYTLPFSLGSATASLTVLECGGQTTGCGGGDSAPTLSQVGAVATVDINDQPFGGQHQFEVELSWTVPGGGVPEPATAALSGAGLIALGLLGRKWKR